MEVVVKKRYYRQSPSKIRPNLYLIKGQKSDKALDVLKYLDNKASNVLYQLLKSGIAAAKEKEMEESKLVIKNVQCDQANRLKRHIFKARGRTARITKRLSHITLTLTDSYDMKSKVKNEIKKNKKTAKKRITMKKSSKSDKANIKNNKSLPTDKQAKPKKESDNLKS